VRLNLTQLETFRKLAVEENFTRTAELLNLTQPAVTQHVRALQEHFHVKLVDLVGRKTVLTDAGRFLAARAELLLGNVAALEREMHEFADVRAGELHIGATLTIGTYVLPELVARFRTTHPSIVLRVEIENTRAMALAVKAGRVSLALVEGPLADDELEIEPYAEDELVLVVAPSHSFARKRKRIEARDLASEAFIAREEGSGTRELAEQLLGAAGVIPNVVLALPTGEGIVRAVELGLGVAIVSRLVAEPYIRERRIARVHLSGLTFGRTFRVVRLRHRTPSPAALAFSSLLFDRTHRARAVR
jgi:DNA-binding transcriptional LysR family regulator